MVEMKRLTEREMLEDLDPDSSHTEEFVQPQMKELSPLQRFKGSVRRYERPTDPVWDEFFDSRENFIVGRDQPSSKG